MVADRYESEQKSTMRGSNLLLLGSLLDMVHFLEKLQKVEWLFSLLLRLFYKFANKLMTENVTVMSMTVFKTTGVLV